MKSMRFANVVERAGKPDIHLMLVAPEKDASFQRALKANRVMTLHQAGTADYGIVGYEKGVTGQILVFPKSLKSFEGARIIGVKYDLLEDAPAQKAKPVQAPTRERKPKPNRKPVRPKKPAPEPPPPEKVVAFKPPEPEEHEEEENQRVLDLEAGIHHAMEMLEAGKQVAAFNILKRLVN